MVARKKEVTANDEKNNDLIGLINKRFGKKVATTLDKSESASVKECISTGSIILDIYCANRAMGGFPVGKLSAVEGEEQSGKSLMVAHAAIDTLKRDGTVIFIDNEHGVDRDFFKRAGVDDKKLIYVDGLDYMEQVFDLIESVSISFRKDNPTGLLTIIWDSITSTPTKAEIEGEFDAKQVGEAARTLSTNIKKILKVLSDCQVCLVAVNQLRTRIAKPGERAYGDMLIPTGGKAVPYYATVRIKLSKGAVIKDQNDVQMGVFTHAKVIKTRLGPPFRQCDLNIYFSHGIDDKDAWLEVLKKYDVVKTEGTWYVFPDMIEKKFREEDFKEKMKDKEFREKVERIIVEKLVVDYDKVDIGQLVVENIDKNSLHEVEALAQELKSG